MGLPRRRAEFFSDLLGAEEIAAAREELGRTDPPFIVPEAITAAGQGTTPRPGG
jgi:hypothetical protein